MIYYITPERWQSIPEEYKTESSHRYGSRACPVRFLSSVSDGDAACYERVHFFVRDTPPEYTEAQRHNGYYAVQCLTEKAQAAYKMADGLTVWEYHGTTSDRVTRWILYAYQYGDDFADDMTENDLIDFLEALYDRLEVS